MYGYHIVILNTTKYFNFRRHFDEVMKLLKWPFISGAEHSPPPKEVMIKFTNLIRYLFLIEEPEDLNINAAVAQDFGQGLFCYVKCLKKLIN